MTNRNLVAVLCALFICFALATASPAQEGKRLLTLDDYGEIRTPGAPSISPDGRQVAFAMEDRIFLIANAGDEPRALTASAAKSWSPRWSSDGSSLYFLSDRSDTAQLWRLPVDTFGEAEQLSEFEHGIASVNLSPDEARVLLSLSASDLAESDDEQEPKPFVVTRRQFKRDAGGGYIQAADSPHLYVYDLEAEALTQLTSGEHEERGGAWSPDGRTLVFVSNRDDADASYTTDLWLVSADNDDKGAALTRLTDNANTKGSAAFSPDGELIAYLTQEDGVYGQQHVAVVPASGGEPRVLTAELDRWVSAYEFSDDGRWIYFTYETSGATHLARVRLRDGHIETVIDGDRVVWSFDLARRGEIAFTSNGRTDEVDIYRLDGDEIERLTNLNASFFDEIRIGNRFRVSFTSTDDTIVESFITTPPGFDPTKRYPAILNIHGGPVGQFSWGFGFSNQFFASNGYVVIEPNPRGSTGRGQAFIREIYEIWGEPDYDDVMAAVDFAIEQGFVDPDRLAVTGYSYGGYMTNVVITNTNRFKAAASGAGHSLIEANFGHDIYQQWYVWELGLPWVNREKYDRLSPFLRVGNIETPTIFLGGRIDWNVPVLNAELMYQALQVRGIDSTLVVYPDTHHGGWSEAFEKDYLRRIAEWFDRYVGVE